MPMADQRARYLPVEIPSVDASLSDLVPRCFSVLFPPLAVFSSTRVLPPFVLAPHNTLSLSLSLSLPLSIFFSVSPARLSFRRDGATHTYVRVRACNVRRRGRRSTHTLRFAYLSGTRARGELSVYRKREAESLPRDDGLAREGEHM